MLRLQKNNVVVVVAVVERNRVKSSKVYPYSSITLSHENPLDSSSCLFQHSSPTTNLLRNGDAFFLSFSERWQEGRGCWYTAVLSLSLSLFDFFSDFGCM